MQYPGLTMIAKRLPYIAAVWLLIALTAPSARGDEFKDGRIIDLVLAGQTLKAELALTWPRQAKGLGGREFMSADQGMLFVYESKKIRPFWMKGMKIPIDIIWLADDRVVGAAVNVPPPKAGQEPVRVYPPRTVDMVLETRAGWSRANNLKPGDRVVFPNGRPHP